MTAPAAIAAVALWILAVLVILIHIRLGRIEEALIALHDSEAGPSR